MQKSVLARLLLGGEGEVGMQSEVNLAERSKNQNSRSFFSSSQHRGENKSVYVLDLKLIKLTLTLTLTFAYLIESHPVVVEVGGGSEALSTHRTPMWLCT
jgi:hypothetical protein